MKGNELLIESRRRKSTIVEHVDTMGTTVYSSEDNESMHKSLNGEFILYQVLLQRILEGKYPSKSSKPSILEHFHPDKQSDEEAMKEFDLEYESSKAIHWYTRETCIYRILNKALRTYQIDDLLPFGQFIRDLNKQLSQEQMNFIKKQRKKSSVMHVYRGQLISKDELNRLKTSEGQFISMNSFLSTSTNRTKALQFATSRPPPNDQLTNILLEIDVHFDAQSKPYADIQRFSAFPEEEEILFMFGCVFRIQKIRFDQRSKLWIAQWELCSENDSDMKKFSSALDEELKGQNRFISLGNYFIEMQKYEEAEEHFEHILKENFANNPLERAYSHHGLATVKIKKGDFNLAISNLQEALRHLSDNPETKDHPLISQCYNDLGSIYLKQEKHLLAFEFYEKALKTKNNISSNTYAGLGQMQFKLENYILALEYFQRALDNQPRTAYASIADNYIQLGNVYAAINEKNIASQMFDKAMQFQRKILNENHPDIGYTYIAMALMYSGIDDEQKAFEYIDKAHQLQMKTLPNYHFDFAQTYKVLAGLYMKKEDYDRALFYYDKALENELKTLLWNHPTVAETHLTIGLAHWKKKDYEEALISFHKVLDSEMTRKKFGDTSLNRIFENLANLYAEKGDQDQALIFYLKHLSNQLETKVHEDVSLAETYQTIAHAYTNKNRLKKSLIYYNRLLDCHSQKPTYNDKVLNEVYQMIGKVYLKKHHYDRTLFSYQNLEITKEEDAQNIHFEQRHLDQALHYFKRYLRQQHENSSESDPALADTYQILGNISFEKQYYDQALNYFIQALNIQLKQKNIQDPSLSHLYEVIARIHFQNNSHNQALIALNRLLDSLNKSDQRSRNQAYQLIGNIYLKKDSLNQPSNYILKLIEKKSKKKQLDVFQTDFIFEKRHLRQTLSYFKKLLKNKSFDHFTYEQISLIIANLYLDKQHFDGAAFSFEQLLHYQNQTQPFEYFILAKTHEILATIYQKQFSSIQALEHYRQSLNLYTKVDQPNPYLINNIKYQIEQILSSTG